jgi:predicted small integral membrane protein
VKGLVAQRSLQVAGACFAGLASDRLFNKLRVLSALLFFLLLYICIIVLLQLSGSRCFVSSLPVFQPLAPRFVAGADFPEALSEAKVLLLQSPVLCYCISFAWTVYYWFLMPMATNHIPGLKEARRGTEGKTCDGM